MAETAQALTAEEIAEARAKRTKSERKSRTCRTNKSRTDQNTKEIRCLKISWRSLRERKIRTSKRLTVPHQAKSNYVTSTA